MEDKTKNYIKNKINDLLMKMQAGNNCIGTTSNELLDLHDFTNSENKSDHWTNQDIDVAYAVGCINIGGIEGLHEELKRLKELGLEPHQVISTVRSKNKN